jgi:iron(III) transport system permease protein
LLHQSRFTNTAFAGSVWAWGSAGIALVVSIPVLVVLAALFSPGSENWVHIRDTVLSDYLRNTAALVLLVALLCSLLGVTTAWLCAACEFPFRKTLSWALVLPLAAPAYVIAYVYTDLLEFAGPVQGWLRSVTGWQAGDYQFPPIRSLPGAAVMLSLVLYPYVYLLCRATFVTQSASLFEAARVLGAGPTSAFFRIALPSARPALAGGLALALMETVADFGVVEYFGVPTFTTGIFRAWYSMGDQGAALQLAAGLFTVVAALVLLEHFARRGRVSNPVSRNHAATRRQLGPGRGWLATLICFLPILLGLIIPLIVLGRYAYSHGDPMLGRNFGDYLSNTFLVAGIAAVVTTGCALWLAYTERLHPSLLGRIGVRVATLGYALPGAMLALGILVAFTELDVALASFAKNRLDSNVGLLLTGTSFALIFAYLVRFLTVAYNACHSGLEKIHRRLDDVGRTLGAGPMRLLKEVHVPLIWPAVFSSLLLVFIDVVKELPATLILRPFNFETLATRVYRLASDERLPEASTAALCIVALGLIPALLLSFKSRHSNEQ